MNLREVFRTAIRSLRSNLLRTILSILGIVIGVASVIALVSVGSGAQKRITDQISSLGSNLINISPAFSRGGRGQASQNNQDIFTLSLAGEISAASPAIKSVVPTRQSNGLLINGAYNLQANAVGVTPDYQEIMNYRVAAGRFVRPDDVAESAPIIVLGSEVATTLFPESNPLGASVMAVFGGRRVSFIVTGVMEEKGQVLFSNFDNQVYMPVSTMLHRITGGDTVNSFVAEAASPEQADAAVGQVSFYLTRRLGSADGFRVSSQQSILSTLNDAIGTFTVMLGAIAGISLVVGGIGIMNIMLVTVTERTREIGIRKALGATRKDLLAQFLAEATALSLTGGVTGVVIGWGGATAISRFAGMPTVVSVQAVVLALGFSIGVGLLFGVYPASRAARLDPVVALRYE